VTPPRPRALPAAEILVDQHGDRYAGRPVDERAGAATVGRRPRGHILVIGVDHVADRPGMAPHTAGLAEHLAGSSASVTVLTGHPGAFSGRAASRVQVLRVRRPTVTRGGTLRRAGDELAVLTTALSTPLPHPPDLVIAVTPGLGGAAAAARIAGRHQAPLILVVHDLLSAGPGGRCRGMRVAEATERRLLERAAQVVLVNQDLEPVLRALDVPLERLHLLPPWTPVHEDLDRGAARRALGWPARRFTVLHPVATGPRQDLATVLEAARYLPDQVDLVLTADGARRATVVRQAAGEPRVRVAGRLDGERRRTAIAAADLLLLAERPDPAGHCLPEQLVGSLGAGRPVLAAVPESNATAAELDRTGGAGLIIRPGDPQLLAAAVRALQQDEGLRRAMGQAGRSYAALRLDPVAAMRRLDLVVDTALATG
jgi:glycosyltransferase involved in cell wall biosynthesis